MDRKGGWIFGICSVASLSLIGIALHLWGAREVRSDVGELSFLVLWGAMWLLVVTNLFSWLGLSVIDDVVERKNIAALVSVCAALVAMSIIYIGASAGEGEEYWPNLFCTALGSAGFFGLWIVLELSANVSKSIAEERDVASGLRMGGFVLAIALIIARALAGDWHSPAETMRDFVRDGWPAAILCAIAVFIERLARPSRGRPFPTWPTFGMLPGLFYLALASAWFWHLGPWQGMP